MAEAFAKRGHRDDRGGAAAQGHVGHGPGVRGLIAQRLEAHGVHVLTGVGLKAIHPDVREVRALGRPRPPAGLVLLSVGVRPELELARQAGLAIGESGGLLVDEPCGPRTRHIWAAGDMNEIVHKVSGRKVRIPLAGPANRQGRIAASNALGQSHEVPRCPRLQRREGVRRDRRLTGLTEAAARAAGFEREPPCRCGTTTPATTRGPRSWSSRSSMTGKPGGCSAARPSARRAGKAHRHARGGAPGQARPQDLAELDLAYAPPYSSANDPLNVAAFVGLNDITGFSPLVTAAELKGLLAGGAAAGGDAERPLVLDVRNLGEYEASHLKGALNIPVDELRFRLDEVPRGKPIVVHCRSGFRSHLALRILKQNGFPDVRNLTGGYLSVLAAWRVRKGGMIWQATL